MAHRRTEVVDAIEREAERLGASVTFQQRGKHPHAILEKNGRRWRMGFAASTSDCNGHLAAAQQVRRLVTGRYDQRRVTP